MSHATDLHIKTRMTVEFKEIVSYGVKCYVDSLLRLFGANAIKKLWVDIHICILILPYEHTWRNDFLPLFGLSIQ